jgi:hypothetical protein
MTRRPPRASRGPEDPDDGVAVDGFQRRHRGVEADACGEEHGLAAARSGSELLLGGGLQVQPDRADVARSRATAERALRASPLTWWRASANCLLMWRPTPPPAPDD